MKRRYSGNFKVLAEDIIKLKVVDLIQHKDAVATFKDQHQQTDIKGTTYMVKTEFNVLDVATGSSNKAVLHTYIRKRFFMIQGKGVMKDRSFCKDFFFEQVIKQFMHDIWRRREHRYSL